MGRRSKYDTEIKPHIDEIKNAVAAGATIKEIATAFNIAESTIHKYRKEKKEFSDAFTRGREKVVIEIKAALLKKALGFHYEEKRTNIKEDEKNGKSTFTEITKRYCPPSETAAAMLLRNYDKDYKDSDDTTVKLKEQEAELKKKIANANNWLED